MNERCPQGQHDFCEEGFGVLKISRNSSIRWYTEGKDSILGVSLSVKREEGVIELTGSVYVKSSVTVCSRCRQATGVVFMRLEQLQQLAKQHKELNSLLQRALKDRPA